MQDLLTNLASRSVGKRYHFCEGIRNSKNIGLLALDNLNKAIRNKGIRYNAEDIPKFGTVTITMYKAA